MNPRHNKSVTLIELLIAVVIFSLIVVGFSNIDTFSRYHVMSSDRRVKLQNDASYVLEHMARNITGTDTLGGAIGDETNPPSSQPVDTSNIGSDTAIQIWIDYNHNGQRDAGDRRIAYRFTGSPTAYQIKFCPECANPPCTNCNPNWNSTEILSSRISSFSPTYDNTEIDGDPIDDYVEVQLIACWNAKDSPATCGTAVDNPALRIKNRISMPAVSTH